MVDQSAIEDRGREVGLMPRRRKLSIGRHGKRWMDVPAHAIMLGDIWLGHGTVRQITVFAERPQMEVKAGSDMLPVTLDPEEIIRVFGRPREEAT